MKILNLLLVLTILCFAGCAAPKQHQHPHTILVDIKTQKLELIKNNHIIKEYSISTSRFGVGFKSRSKKTPTGEFRIFSKIGDNLPISTNFKGRAPTRRKTGIIARILQLDGLEKTNSNTLNRCIYIHGTKREVGRPGSIGCITLRPLDVIDLYAKVEIGTRVEIVK